GYLDALATAARSEGSEIVLGILRRARSDGPVFNSIVVLGETPQIYDKRHLVPFGEYFPVPGFVRDWMRLLSLPYSDLGVGGARQPVLQTTVAALAPSICYEDAFGEQMLAFLPQAGMLVNVSNDAWFGDSIAPHQHLQIARMRSVEAGRATLRATNTGISAVIDHHGKLLAQSPQFEVSVLRADVSVRTGATPFVRFGNLAVVALALVLIAAGTALGRRQVVSGRRR
ncbi:MAG: apolipoprotein N-acyltransferase, partial [Chromatiales bacterium]|nr:apolipoprotein N-acyltransferase [Chromatiales bacterium]